ncbi:hypothetical protein BGX34_006849, partial [Mortierella sp. NVP85]
MSRKQGKQAISQEEITWINSADDKSAAAFIKKFELNEKLTAHYRYRLLIETTNNISKTDKNRLLNEFDWWKNNNDVREQVGSGQDRSSHRLSRRGIDRDRFG